MKLILILTCLIIPFASFSGDARHRSVIANLVLSSSIDRPLRNTFWISNIDLTAKSNDLFINSSGATVIVVDKIVSSAYDEVISYDISKFYKKTNNRVKLISNFVLDKPNTIYSIGFDSGIISKKIRIERNLFLGIAHVIDFRKRSQMMISVGSWFGGGIKELPCYDMYDREYWCQNLTSWADYKPTYPKNLIYIDFRYIHKF